MSVWPKHEARLIGDLYGGKKMRNETAPCKECEGARAMLGDAAVSPEAAASTVDAAEVAKFAALAAEWWDPHGPLRPLHKLNPVRLGFIRDEAEKAFGTLVSSVDGSRLPGGGSASPPSTPPARRPLSGLTLLDIGCGGGLVSEPMARLGARVTGVDAAPEGIGAARARAEQSGLAIDYRVATAEALAAAGEAFDIVVALEIVEHTADPTLFLTTCARLVAPRGLLVVSTLNRTPRAFALGVVGAEYILGWLPRGSHDWSKFLRPDEVAAPLRDAGMEVGDPVGMTWSLANGEWGLSRDASINYLLAARGSAVSSSA
jgi:2-polyprenyl-6-hydroxyphenyl methylase/3-demethylubiquinone-9 3-methyltransferase